MSAVSIAISLDTIQGTAQWGRLVDSPEDMASPEEAGTMGEVVDLSKEDEDMDAEDAEASSGENLAMSMKSNNSSRPTNTTMRVKQMTRATMSGLRRRKERPL